MIGQTSSQAVHEAIPHRRFRLRRQSTIGRLLHLKMAIFGLGFIAIVAVAAVFAPLLAPYSPNETLTFRSEAPSWQYPLGTDAIGRDTLSRLLYGARASLQVSLTAAAFAVSIGSVLGLIAAYFGRFLDFLVMRTADAMLALPGIILPLLLLAALGGGVSTVSLALGVGLTPQIARLMRAQALSQMERDYVQAAISLGANPVRIMIVHVARNSLAPIIVAGSLGMSFAVIAEAGLSFLGVGVTPPTATWGTMLSTSFTNIRTAPWQAFGPGAAIFLLVLSFNFVGDALRDVLDPRLRGSV